MSSQRPKTNLDRLSDPGLFGATPATYSYNDALLTGKMSRAELAAIRAEILGEVPVAPPKDFDGEDDQTLILGPNTRVDQIKALIRDGDYNGALSLAERLLEEDPNNAAAKRCIEICNTSFCRAYLKWLGGEKSRLVIAMSPAELAAVELDSWAAFVLSRIDGSSPVEDIMDISSISQLDTLRILYELVQRGVLRLEH